MTKCDVLRRGRRLPYKLGAVNFDDLCAVTDVSQEIYYSPYLDTVKILILCMRTSHKLMS